MFEIIDIEEVSNDCGTVIKVIGVGGGGGNAVESVFIPEDDRGTLCVSSQAGCAVGVAARATRTANSRRNGH